MEDLQKLNRSPGVATNSMCTFLAVNTAGLQLIPASMISLLASAGSKEPTAIIGTTIAASTAAVFAGVIAAKLLERLPVFAVPPRESGGASS
jgi:spore maturation protein A